jgi:hypothetical protein
MSTYKLSAETKAKLMTVSTATLCTALFKRGLPSVHSGCKAGFGQGPQHGGPGVYAALHSGA